LIKIFGAVVLTSLVLLPVRWQPGMTATNDPKTEKVVDTSGNLRVPGDYRTAYQFLGSWAVSADQGTGSKEIHVVYASPCAAAAYRKNGRFTDGSVLVKEVFETTTGAMTTGTVSHAQTLKGWFVLMKDSKNSHPGNKLWGNGWGWSWFDVADGHAICILPERSAAAPGLVRRPIEGLFGAGIGDRDGLAIDQSGRDTEDRATRLDVRMAVTPVAAVPLPLWKLYSQCIGKLRPALRCLKTMHVPWALA
jgi:hypothetical protein